MVNGSFTGTRDSVLFACHAIGCVDRSALDDASPIQIAGSPGVFSQVEHRLILRKAQKSVK